ncbi:hypothetical protein [Anaerovorax odorimutans]|uniref:hypothetical protein n=1 Tax=Anaerovorax odorimutans TaxID=109327 RepID=UPI0003F7701D|nr:hypothetical protein [Anaerovorax odorimutans]
MTQRNFKIIKGGISATIQNKKKTFISAFVTDTRLMGVVVLYIHWELDDDNYSSNFHQFFYFDAEEYGLESYKSHIGDDPGALSIIEQALLGGLGGQKVEITEKESYFLVSHFTETNKRLSLNLPEGKVEYEFLLDKKETENMSRKEKMTALSKMCTPIISDYQLINYFLMRSFAKDKDGFTSLIEENSKISDISQLIPATLCKNTIDEFIDEKGLSYICESLIEFEKKYMLVITEFITSNYKIVSVNKKSSFYISSAEAAMMLNRAEFITVYEILNDVDEFEMQFNAFSTASLQTIHENGKLSLQFKKNNNHVNKKIFRLNDDIHGLYYITNLGQFLIAAYSLPAIQELERELKNNTLDQFLIPSAKYEFKEPILYEFIQSDFDDFIDFLDSLSNDFND